MPSAEISADEKLMISFLLKIGPDTLCKFARNVKSYILGKIRKIFQKVGCLIFFPACKVLTDAIS